MDSKSCDLGFLPVIRSVSATSIPTDAATIVRYACARPSRSIGRSSGTTSWPRSASSLAAFSTAASHIGSVLRPSIDSVENPMRRDPGSRPSAARKSPSGGEAYGDPTSEPWVPSRKAALSRTVRLTTWRTTSPFQDSPSVGPSGVRAREGLSPNSPQADAGIRMLPPPSPAWATGTIPAATAAPDPPLDPPGVWSVFHGLRAGPRNSDSVMPMIPNSGQLVFPTKTTPALRYRAKSSESWLGT